MRGVELQRADDDDVHVAAAMIARGKVLATQSTRRGVMQVLGNEPHELLVDRVDRLCRDARAVFFASAFVGEDVIKACVEPALDRGVRVHLITGIFGYANRLAMFRRVLRMSRKTDLLQARVWSRAGHQQLHAKLYLWELSKGGWEAWIGSANLTSGGLNNPGELVLACTGAGAASPVRQLREGFDRLWRASRLLDAEFVAGYREAPRPPPDATIYRIAKLKALEKGRLLWVTSTQHYVEGSRVYGEVEARLPRAETEWYRGYGAAIAKARRGDRICVVDRPTQSIAFGVATDVVSHGAATVVAYHEDRSPKAKWGVRARDAVRTAGVALRGDFPSTRWLSAQQAELLASVIAKLARR